MESTLNIRQTATTGTHKIQAGFVILIVMLFFSPGLIQSASAAVTGPGSAWQYCRRITLSPVTPAANFQVKVSLAAGQYTGMNANGNDLRFYDVNNNLCNYWIETWNTGSASTIWVKVTTSGANALYMYYGNGSASAATNGASTFDFFDGFDGSSLSANWQQSTSNATVSVSGGQVTLSCNSNSGSVNISSPFTTASTSFFLETKHLEGAYYRNRFYAATSLFGTNPLGFDNGYFYNGSAGARSTAQVFWNGTWNYTVNANTNYLSRWLITDGSTYNWYTLTYSDGVIRDTRTSTTTSTIRYITIALNEASGTSIIVDWVRVRKYTASEPVLTVGSQVTNVSASIASPTNVTCYGLSNGSATVTATGGSGGYTYLWNSSPAQSTQTAVNLPAGSYTATVTENSISISATATAIITQPTALTTTTTQTNITCNGRTDGTITITANGGTSPYQYSIYDGAPYTTGSDPNRNIFSGLSANVQYKIRVKDNNGCESVSIP